MWWTLRTIPVRSGLKLWVWRGGRLAHEPTPPVPRRGIKHLNYANRQRIQRVAKHYYPQAVLLQALEKYWDAELKNPELLHCLRKTATYRRHRYWWYWKKS
jgi:hypothetical protein